MKNKPDLVARSIALAFFIERKSDFEKKFNAAELASIDTQIGLCELTIVDLEYLLKDSV